MTSASGVSIVVITFNGSQKLISTLDHLFRLKVGNISVELIIIDNDSDDDTRSVLGNKLAECPYEHRVIHEKKKGQAFARRTGILNARFEYVLFCDDDNWLNEDYLVRGMEVITRDESIAALGGMGIPVFENENKVPSWFDDYKKAVGCGPQGERTGDTTFYKGCLYTAGTFISKQWFEKLEKLNISPALTGRVGGSLIGGEDTELTYYLKILGGKLYFSEELTFQHFMPDNRLNKDYFRKLYRSFGYSNEILVPVLHYIRSKQIVRTNRFKEIIRTNFHILSAKSSVHKLKKVGINSFEEELNLEKLRGKLIALKKGHSKLKIIYGNLRMLQQFDKL